MVSLAKLLGVLIAIESGGDPNAVGDNGQAVGILQMHPEIIEDVNRVYTTGFNVEDRKDVDLSKAICILYLIHYVNKDRLGYEPTIKDYALCWHYGPNFNKITDRHNYWDKVVGIFRSMGVVV